MAIFKKNTLGEFNAYKFDYDGQTENTIQRELTLEIPSFQLLDLEIMDTVSMTADGVFANSHVLYLKQRAYNSYGQETFIRHRLNDSSWLVESRPSRGGYSVMDENKFFELLDT